MNKKPENPENPAQGALFPPGRRIVTKAEYARIRGVSPASVTRALQENRIQAIRINGKEMIDVVAADASWSASTRARIDALPPPPRGPRDTEPDRKDELRELRVSRERLIVERLALDLDQRAGLLVERHEVDFILTDMGTRWRAALESLADRLAPEIFGLADLAAVHRHIEAAAHRVLRDFTDGLARAAEDFDALAAVAPGDAAAELGTLNENER